MVENKTNETAYKNRKYSCKECGYQKVIQTNHTRRCYSIGNFNVCPKCPPYKRPNVWVCDEKK